jgi:hypothetical protein
MPELTLGHLASALAAYPNYNAIDVFADDLVELQQLKNTNTPPAGMTLIDATGDRYLVAINGRSHVLALDRQAGVAHLVRTATASDQQGVGIAVGAVIGGAATAAIGAALTKKGEGWMPGLILGLLVGAAIGGAATQQPPQPSPRRVFTLRFNPNSQTWEAYDGGLVGWMKNELATGQT